MDIENKIRTVATVASLMLGSIACGNPLKLPNPTPEVERVPSFDDIEEEIYRNVGLINLLSSSISKTKIEKLK